MITTASRDIAGIYNYCDRWCERCAHTARCRLYKDLDEKGGHDREMSMESTLEFVKAMFAETRRKVEAEAEARGIRLPTEAELEEIGREKAARRTEIDSHPLARLAIRYNDLLDAWWPAEHELLRGNADDLLARCEQMADPGRLEAEARGVFDAFEVIQWYRYQIHVKLRRALSSRSEGRWGRSDANGSAKVALIGVDRSLAAWHVLQQWCHETTTHQVLVDVLTELRAAAERVFPRARAFRRPGFDSVKLLGRR
jgi:hypothetical protein